MTITSTGDYINAQKQSINFFKSGARTTVASIQFSLIDLAGTGPGTLAGSNTSAGVVPDDTTAGTPAIDPFGARATGYISLVDFNSSVSGRIYLYDMLWKAGAYNAATSNTITSPPSFEGRMPDYSAPNTFGRGNQIWLETVTAFTGLQSCNIGYTNDLGVAGQQTGVIATGIAPTLGRMFRMPLQAGDNGVSSIQSIQSTVATQGTFNVLILRPLWQGRCRFNHEADVHGLDKTGLPIVYANSALFMTVAADGTGSGVPNLQIEVSSL